MGTLLPGAAVGELFARDGRTLAIQLEAGPAVVRLGDEVRIAMLPPESIPFEFSGDGRYLYFARGLQRRLYAYDVEGDWSRAITGRGVSVEGVVPVRSALPIVWRSQPWPSQIYWVDEDGELAPLTTDEDVGWSVVTRFR